MWLHAVRVRVGFTQTASRELLVSFDCLFPEVVGGSDGCDAGAGSVVLFRGGIGRLEAPVAYRCDRGLSLALE